MKNQESLVDQIVSQLVGLQQTSAPGAGSPEEVTIPPTPQVVVSPEILPELQGDSSAAKAKPSSSVFNPENNPGYYHITDSDEEDKSKKMEEKIKQLEDQMKIVKGDHDYPRVDVVELSLVPNLVLPPKFKSPKFEKFDKNSFTSAHITIKPILDIIRPVFFDRWCGAPSCPSISAETIGTTPANPVSKSVTDRLNREGKSTLKTPIVVLSFVDSGHSNNCLVSFIRRRFENYSRAWRGQYSVDLQFDPIIEGATESVGLNHPVVQPAKPIKYQDLKGSGQVISGKIQTLKAPYFRHLVAIISGSFSDLVMAGEMIESVIKQGKIKDREASKKPHVKEMDGEINNVITYHTNKSVTISKPKSIAVVPSGTSKQDSREPRWEREHFDPIVMTYKEFYHQLLDTHVVSPYLMEPMKPTYPKWYDENAHCEYHSSVPGHTIENCYEFKRVVQKMRNQN
ncbi:hypothetical protein F3Y22_tig00117034pilonHSYRG00350 [Hibiscus syriacus]|uniref:Uncharacterized protein n=1 Tax=Hibiscus syriacus TaxID=106335 RepID=A0A6A2WZ77_HIBSY|nr:hypothetical protein F3Y22_tig00117034pilonHSYRG00350 [Hibiscus syriacus]